MLNVALKRLLEGHKSYRQDVVPTITSFLSEQSQGQAPIALVLSCCDSRVVPSVLFNCQLGELFESKTIGNIAGSETRAAIEYAVSVLKISHILVLGHEDCGAMKAVLSPGDMPLPNVFSWLRQAHKANSVARACKNEVCLDKDYLEAATKVNVLHQVEVIEQIAKELVSGKESKCEHSVQIHGLYYRIATGKIEIFQCSSKQAKLAGTWRDILETQSES